MVEAIDMLTLMDTVLNLEYPQITPSLIILSIFSSDSEKRRLDSDFSRAKGFIILSLRT
jgi:hypothetical protein